MLWAFRTRVSVTTTSSPFPSGCSAPWTHENGDATRTRSLPNHRRADRSRLARPLVRKWDVATDSAGLFVGSASGAKGSRRSISRSPAGGVTMSAGHCSLRSGECGSRRPPPARGRRGYRHTRSPSPYPFPLRGRGMKRHAEIWARSAASSHPPPGRAILPCGQTPILYQRGRARDKVSIIAALTRSPRRHRPGLYFSLRANEHVTTAWLVPFLRALTRHLRGSFVLVWDRLPGHRAHVVTEYLHHRHRAVALLPPYAPELNPVEILWAYLKSNPLANFAASDALHLARVTTRHVQRLQRRPELVRSFFEATPLFFTRL